MPTMVKHLTLMISYGVVSSKWFNIIIRRPNNQWS